MRDPFTWSFPFGRLFGVSIRVHIWFVLVALGLVLRAAFQPDPEPPAPPFLPNLWIDASILMGLLLLAVLLHELGHVFAARMVDGETHEIMLWPLGGLGNYELPQTPYASFVTAAAGPLVNLFLCAAAGLLLVSHSLVPPWSPGADQLAPRLYDYAEGRYYYDTKYQQAPERLKLIQERDLGKPAEPAKAGKPAEPIKVAPPAEPAVEKGPSIGPSVRAALPEPGWLGEVDVLASRFFWINWILVLFNLLPAFPLDGGRMLQAFFWSRLGSGRLQRQATQAAIKSGFVVMMGLIILGTMAGSLMLLILAWIVYTTCKSHWYVLETGNEEPGFGYDLGPGYASPEGEATPRAQRQPRPNIIQRWLRRRADRKQQRELEQRVAEERRLDELLEKITQNGIQALTEEERRFLTRVSRYKQGQ